MWTWWSIRPTSTTITDEDLEAAGKTVKQNVKVMRGYADTAPENAKRRIVFRFRTSPVEIKGDGPGRGDCAGQQRVGHRRGRTRGRQGHRRTRGTARAVGDPRGRLPRGATPGLPFDEKSGTIPHTDGRIDGSRNEYVVGWIKRGPSGVIGSNKKDSAATVDTLLADLAAAPAREVGADYSDELVEWLVSRQPALVTDDHWQLIDAHERAAGEPTGRPRVKLTTVAELLRVGHA